MQQNAISITITPAQETAILTKIDELRVLLEAFSVSLTDEERAGFFKLGDARLAFDAKCSDYIHQRADLVPASINVTEYDKDGAAWGAVNRVYAKLNTLAGTMTDTLMVIGSDRLDADLTFYNYLGFAARTGAAGADDIRDDLKQTYPGRRTVRTPTPPPTPPTP
jgi:hypothetical protein